MTALYIKLALRNLARHRLYACINILGLAMGLCVFLFSEILISYEYNHDHMFAKRARIFTAGSVFAKTSEEPVKEYPVVRTVYGPLLRAKLKETAHVVRVPHRESLIKIGNAARHVGIRFAEPGFTRVFDFEYIHGNKAALDDPRGLVITESQARANFGRVDVLGERVSLEHEYSLRITAVIRDVPPDSHFNSSLLPAFELTFIAPLEALIALGDFRREGDRETLDPADMTYILLPPNRTRAWLQGQADAVYAKHADAAEKAYISRIKIRPLIDSNIVLWDAMGFPMLESVRLLGLLILLVACANYTNLATAQNFGRDREVGLRMTFGARRPHLLAQFLSESIALTALAMLIALAGVELLIPAYNDLTGKAVRLEYLRLLPRVFLVVTATGLLAGAYPAYLISRRGPLSILRDAPARGPRGNAFRVFMVAAQFSVTIFILSMVMIIFFQNRRVLEISEAWPKTDVFVLEGTTADEIRSRREELRRAMTALPGVKAMAFSSGVPFYETSRTQKSRRVAAKANDKDNAFTLDLVSVDRDFQRVYGIDLAGGRTLNSGDTYAANTGRLNIVVNQIAARRLGFPDDAGAVGREFHALPDRRNPRAAVFTIVGLMPDVYFIGPQSKIKPMAFLVRPEYDYYASLRLTGRDRTRTTREIEKVWRSVLPDYPPRGKLLGSYFQLFFRLLKTINGIIAVFAGVALLLALIGLFGLAAFMARLRLKEIGIRKVMGASTGRITRLLIARFSRPVFWSLPAAMPSAYLAAGIYLDFFPEPIAFVLPIILLAGAAAILSAWAVVAGHALRIARTPPMDSLRRE